MTNLAELIAERDKLNKQIQELELAERKRAIETIRSLISKFDLIPEDVFDQSRKKTDTLKIGKLPPKYLDPITGATWSGRGRTPAWLDGKSKDEFLLK